MQNKYELVLLVLVSMLIILNKYELVLLVVPN